MVLFVKISERLGWCRKHSNWTDKLLDIPLHFAGKQMKIGLTKFGREFHVLEAANAAKI